MPPKTTKKDEEDPLYSFLLAKANIKELPRPPLLSNKRLSLEPALLPYLFDKLSLKKEDVLDEFQLPGKFVEAYSRFLRGHYGSVLYPQEEDVFIRFLSALALIHLSHPPSEGPEGLWFLIERYVLDMRSLIIKWDTRKLEVEIGPQAGVLYSRARTTLDPLNYGCAAEEALEAIKKALKSTQEPGHREIRGEREMRGGGTRMFPCERCGVLVKGGGFKAHNQICSKKKRKTEAKNEK